MKHVKQITVHKAESVVDQLVGFLQGLLDDIFEFLGIKEPQS